MYAVLMLANRIIDIYLLVIVLSVVLSWLVALDVVNTRNRFVFLVGDTLHRLTEPVCGRIRRLLPDTGVLDLAPLVVFLGLLFAQDIIDKQLKSLS